ncbi:MAG TPA: 16S rRNA (adenine(1518)-N(6)/adenine(1519)-N(6))-dimethyltransferase RsmA [Terriglobales bacterium]|nr:16S rRNA (adenine(1518)-N(6)/adenine(1519)-N(6))-dimethyltransferase RsmA [Terriglobales bacterium]
MPKGSSAVSKARPAIRKPKLGQHFLREDSAALRIVDALGEISDKTVLEIGPGNGALTGALVRRARRVIAIELDKVLAAQLRMRFATATNIEVIEGDVLSIDFATIFGPKPGTSRPGIQYVPEPAQVVGNLPYYITSDILLRLFQFRRYFHTIVIMVQKEVADRLVARSGTSDYGLLSATAQLHAKVEKLFTLPPGAFTPPPKVHSSVLRLTIAPQMDKLGVDEDRFIDFLKLSFAQKRKTLWNNLKLRYQPKLLKAALEKTNVKPEIRAEALSLEKSAAVFRALSKLDGTS